MMNRKVSFPLTLPRLIHYRPFMAIFGLLLAVIEPGPVNAQLTLDGTNCVIFADMFDGEIVRCVARRHDGSTLKISLIGKRPNRITRIELSINGLPPFQTLNVVAEPTIDHQNIGLLITDMNFDKLVDFAVMEFAGAGPNTQYLYFLFHADTGKFEASPALSKITAPTFDALNGTITSRWRDSATRTGQDSYVWHNDKLKLVERTERTDEGAQCLIRTYKDQNGKLELVKSAGCAD
ncbi:MAG: hypothetical protein HKN11_17960 [Rhizobiales bacterium]|nr:hypothetical protein [Hyphomicrobiales bacterium]